MHERNKARNVDSELILAIICCRNSIINRNSNIYKHHFVVETRSQRQHVKMGAVYSSEFSNDYTWWFLGSDAVARCLACSSVSRWLSVQTTSGAKCEKSVSGYV